MVLIHSRLIERPDGTLVCTKHHSPQCYPCALDLSSVEYEGSLPGWHAHPPEFYHFDDCVPVLRGSNARFIPQTDEQLKSCFWESSPDHNPLITSQRVPLSKLDLHECQDCQLTWLVGFLGRNSASSHPSHHTHRHGREQQLRSLLVFVDGACSNNGYHGAQAGIGVHFHPDSPLNVSEPLRLPETVANSQTNQKAELSAIARALEMTRALVPSRREMAHDHGHGCVCGCMHAVSRFRLIVTTDSSYAVECMCSHLPRWGWDESAGHYFNKKSKKFIQNSGLIRDIEKEIGWLAELGVQVVFYHVLRHENAAADALARQGANAVLRLDTVSR